MSYLGKWIARAYRAAHVFMAEELRDIGIGHGQFPFLIFLSRKNGACQEQISNELFFDKATITRVLVRLEENGFVGRKVSAVDRRWCPITTERKLTTKITEHTKTFV